MLSTRAVFAVFAGICLTCGVVAPRFGRGVVGSWLLAVGFLAATAWSLLSVAWTQTRTGALTPELYLSMTAMAAAGAVYFGYRAAGRKPPA
ncbi:hypothetical protein [Halomarina pelagica]|uniref:hypothetical protein n=1 Tax=Halomarina pelagica TaxID=2961599 RepID=UPI0020C34A76|nr:hypothetical protein [Halomarina sp. BND7]